MTEQRAFTPDDIKYIADLPNHMGWAIFRDLVQATHDNLLNALAEAPTQEAQARIYLEWKNYRTFLANILNMEAYANQLMQQLEAAQNMAQGTQAVFETQETRITEGEHAAMMQHLQPPPNRLLPTS